MFAVKRKIRTFGRLLNILALPLATSLVLVSFGSHCLTPLVSIRGKPPTSARR